MAFDAGGLYYSYQNAGVDQDEQAATSSRRQIVDAFKRFIQEFFRKDSDDTLVYRQALNKDPRILEVDLVDVRAHDQALGEALEERPQEYLPHFERAAKEVLQEDHQLTEQGEEKHFADVQVMITSSLPFGPASIRQLTSDRVMQLVQIPGIVTSAGRPKHKGTYLTIQCKTCRSTQSVAVRPGFGAALIPRRCSAMDGQGPNESCKPGTFVVLGDRSTYVDLQTLKLQERPEDIPTGELPRTLMMLADRLLVNTVTPGSRVTVTAVYCTYRPKNMDGGGKGGASAGGGAMLQQPYLRVVGLTEDNEGHKSHAFTNEDIAGFMEFARSKGVHDALFARMAPKIFGSRGSSVEHIKAAICCLLFGGARKIMPDGTTRRGDINVLLLGDPSTAKSQFLKFVHKVAPICVYTSGKGSSAAGLTAAVVQDPGSREFYLEGGAMVLADGGVVCIDEFDKMRPEDRVAIHEAMEQQTISIAKAGITTVLKSRTSVLAAANPPSGRYDDLRSTAENIDLQSTVLSRFDLIFIVRDVADRDNDEAIARHVLSVHQRAGGDRATGAAAAAGDVSVEDAEERWLSRYISYCRSHCFPRLTDEARRELRGMYVDIRDKARRAARQEDSEEPPIPITVRQLEALVRISEALARMELAGEATPDHVARAFELFKQSTLNAMSAGLVNTDAGQQQETSQVQAIEQRICDRLARGAHLSFKRLVEDLAGQGFSAPMVAQAVRVMEQRGELRKRQEGKVLVRV